MSIESRYAQSLRSRGVLCVCQNLGYYNSQFILVASDTILTLGLFIVDSKNKETLKVVGTLRVP